MATVVCCVRARSDEEGEHTQIFSGTFAGVVHCTHTATQARALGA
jgi:hypothetical protein